MPAQWARYRKVPLNTRRSKPDSVPMMACACFDMNGSMAFLPDGWGGFALIGSQYSQSEMGMLCLVGLRPRAALRGSVISTCSKLSVTRKAIFKPFRESKAMIVSFVRWVWVQKIRPGTNTDPLGCLFRAQAIVNDGWITLEGQVEWNYERERAEDTAG